jgi:hypothetical protein
MSETSNIAHRSRRDAAHQRLFETHAFSPCPQPPHVALMLEGFERWQVSTLADLSDEMSKQQIRRKIRFKWFPCPFGSERRLQTVGLLQIIRWWSLVNSTCLWKLVFILSMDKKDFVANVSRRTWDKVVMSSGPAHAQDRI